jgi:ankyrin repeat protein
LQLSHGADMNAIDDAGRCALTWAVITEQKSAAKMLLKAGADTESRRGRVDRTALLLAVAERSEVSLLLFRRRRYVPTSC